MNSARFHRISIFQRFPWSLLRQTPFFLPVFPTLDRSDAMRQADFAHPTGLNIRVC